MTENLSAEEQELLKRVRAGAEADRVSAHAPSAAPFSVKRVFPKRPALRKPRRLFRGVAIGFLAIGAALVAVFNVALSGALEQFGAFGVVGDLSEQLQGSGELDDILAGSGFEVYGQLLQLQDARWAISGIIFTGFALLSALFFILDVARQGSHEQSA